MKRVHIITYGCQMNVHDSEMILGVMQAAGYEQTDTPDEADVVLLNTCCVREKPERKVLGKVGDLKRLREERGGLVIGVCGCMAQSHKEALFELAPAIDLVTGPDEIGRLPQLVSAVESGERHITAAELGHVLPASELPKARADDLKAWITIVHGCTNFCSYCVVPHVRGPERSRPLEEVVAEARGLADIGIKEVTLLGQNVNAYGQDLGRGAPAFPELLRAVDGVDGLERIRFTTSHPKDFSDGLIRAVARLEKVCEHVHLPIQAGDTQILERMNRRYTRKRYTELVDRIRAGVPGVALSTDVMVGFPGETEEQFMATYEVFERIRFDQAFMFVYSPRRDTPAAAMGDQIPRNESVERLQRLVALQNEISRERNQADVGRDLEVLVEGPSERAPERLTGRTRTNKIAVFPQSPGVGRGDMVTVRALCGFLWGYEAEAV